MATDDEAEEECGEGRIGEKGKGREKGVVLKESRFGYKIESHTSTLTC